MISFHREREPRPFRIRPAETFDAIREELRRWLEDARETFGSIPRFHEKTITFRGGSTNVPVDFPFRPRVLVVGRVEGPVSPGVAVTASVTATASGKTKLWEWNGSDVSQFESSADFNGSTGASMSSPTLSVVTDASVPGNGKILRLTASGTPSGYACVHWLVKAAESTLTYPNRYRWEWSIKPTIASYGGLSFFANPATDHYYGVQCFSINGSRHRVDAGTAIDFLSGATNGRLASSASSNSAGWVELWGEPQTGEGPRFEISGYGVSTTSSPTAFQLNEDSVNGGTWQNSGTQPPSSWDGLAANRWGLSLVSQSAGSPGNLDFSRLALYRVGDDASTATASATTTTEPPGLSVDWIPASSPVKGATIRAISGLTTGTDYKITLFAVGT